MINGTITLLDGTVIALDDSVISSGSLSVSMSTCRNTQFDLGTFNAAVLNIRIHDVNALAHEFTQAAIVLNEVDAAGATINKLGRYFVDGKKTKRQYDRVSLTAQDGSVLFDTELPDAVRSTSYTPLMLFTAACSAVGAVFAGSDLSGYVNTDVTFDLTNAQLQTWRDAVMWTAQLICANAVINRDGALALRQVLGMSDVGGAAPEKAVPASKRHSMTFSDSRIYIKYLTGYEGNTVTQYKYTGDVEDEQARPGFYALKKNPLLAKKSAGECRTINMNIHAHIAYFMQRQVTAKMFDDASFAPADLLRFSGGSVDVRRSILGFVTGIVWRYHGVMTVTCACPEAAKEEPA